MTTAAAPMRFCPSCGKPAPKNDIPLDNPFDAGLITIARLTATILEIRLPFAPYEGALMSSPRIVLDLPGLSADMLAQLEAIWRSGDTVRVLVQTREKEAETP